MIIANRQPFQEWPKIGIVGTARLHERLDRCGPNDHVFSVVDCDIGAPAEEIVAPPFAGENQESESTKCWIGAT
jgi:hypothetical protein